MKRSFYRRIYSASSGISLISGLFAACPVAAAQDLAADGLSAGTDQGEILVTARKRSEVASRVPDSLVVLGSEAIKNMNVQEAGDVAVAIPNITFKQDLSPTSSFISARGITSTRNSESAVSLVIDGVQVASASQIHQNLSDIAQIEVLKGPQGALYGRNAIGGAINVVTKKPTNTLEGRAEFGFGNANAMEGSASISGPLIEDLLLFRVSGFYHNDDGSIRNTVLNQNVDFKSVKSGRIRLLVTPSADLSVDLKFNHESLRTGAMYHMITRPINAPFPVDDPKSNSNTFTFSPTSVPIGVAYSTINDASANIQFELGFATLSSISAWSHIKERYGVPGEGIGGDGPGDLDFTPNNLQGAPQRYNVEGWSEELRLTSSSSDALRWQLGAYYTSIRRRDSQTVYIGDCYTFPWPTEPPYFPYTPLRPGCTNSLLNPATTLLLAPNGTRRKIDAYAFFGQIDYDITPDLTATAALRYDNEDRVQYDLDAGSEAAIEASKRKVSFHLPTPKFSLAYRPREHLLIYGTIARGFRSGGFNNPTSAFGVVYQQQEVWSYEVGMKGTFFDGLVHAESALFYEDIKNDQDFVFDPQSGTQSLYNIPKASVKGIELSLDLMPATGLKLSASGGIMDSKIKTYSGGEHFPQPFSSASIVGNKLPLFDHWSLNVSADYKADLGSDWTGNFHIDYSLRGKYRWDVTNQDVQKNLGLVNASVGVENGRWGLRAWATNLTNTKYWGNWFNQKMVGLPDVGSPGEPRRYGVSAYISL